MNPRMTNGLINDIYPLILPDFRVLFHADRPNWEKGRLDHMSDTVESGMHVWDIGAEHGDFTALYATWGAHVTAVEPAVKYWPCIKSTMEANHLPPPVQSFKGFLGRTTDLKDETVISHGYPSGSVGRVVADPGFCHLAQQADSIPVINIDDLAHGTDPPDILMIDIEGAEVEALRGGPMTLRHFHPIVYVSWHEETAWNWYNDKLNNLLHLMTSYGYRGTPLPSYGEGEQFWVFL